MTPILPPHQTNPDTDKTIQATLTYTGSSSVDMLVNMVECCCWPNSTSSSLYIESILYITL